MAKKIIGIENIEPAIDKVFKSGNPVWIICTSEEEQEIGYQIAVDKLKSTPDTGTFRITASKSTTGLIYGKRYEMFPALYLSHRNILTLQN